MDKKEILKRNLKAYQQRMKTYNCCESNMKLVHIYYKPVFLKVLKCSVCQKEKYQ